MLPADQELVREYVAGRSDDAFRALVGRHVHLVYGTAYRQTGDRGLAEEITQNVFVVLAQKAPRLAGVHTLAGWLHRTTILEAKARIRAELRRRRREAALMEQVPIPDEGVSAAEEMLPLLDEGLLQLRDTDRLALVLRFFEDRSLRDVGETLGVDEDAARKRVTRALERLADFFRSRGVTVAGASLGATLSSSGATSVPTAVAAGAVKAGLSAGTGSGLMNLLLLQVMAMNKTQTAVVGCLVALLPLLLLYRVEARVRGERLAAEQRVVGLRGDAETLALRNAETEQALVAEQAAAGQVEERIAALQRRFGAGSARESYRWDDASPLLRVPKAFLEQLDLAAVANRRGHLTEQIKAALQLNEAEQRAVQAALDRFVADFNAEQGRTLSQVAARPEDLAGRSVEETRVFQVSALGEELPRLRSELFAALEATLGPERFPVFRKALRDWMPVADENSGMNSGMAVLNFDHRVIFYRPTPGREWLDWQIRKPNGEMMAFTVQRDDIPPAFQPYLKDWIAIANSPDPTESR